MIKAGLSKKLLYVILAFPFLIFLLLPQTTLAANSSYVWTYTMGGTGSDWGTDVTIDSSDNVYLIGSFEGTVDFDPTSGTDNKTSMGGYDIFLTKINADASYGWTYTMGGTGQDRGFGITTDSSGNVYLAGHFQETVDFDPTGGTDNKTSSEYDVFLTKINSDASYGWTYTWTYWLRMGGLSDVRVITDSSGNVYLTGDFIETVDFDPTSGTDNKTSNGSGDLYLIKINADASYGWTYTIGGTDDDGGGPGITTDSSDNLYFTGWFRETVDFDPTGGEDNKTAEGLYYDVFLTKINSDASYGWTYTIGGTGDKQSYGLITNSSGNVYLIGWFNGTVNFDPTPGTDIKTSNGGNDIFLTKFLASPPAQELPPTGNFSHLSALFGLISAVTILIAYCLNKLKKRRIFKK